MTAALAYSAEELQWVGAEARLELAKRAAERGDVLGWGKALFPEKFSLDFCDELHGYFVQIRHIERTCTEAPRGHSKTTIKCFLIPMFQAIHEPDLFRHYLNVQATLEKAMSVNRALKSEFEDNALLAEYFRRRTGLRSIIGERWTDQQFVLSNGIIFTAIGAGQSTRGINYRNRRPDYIIVDDLYDEEEIRNVEATEKVNDWFWGTLYPARTTSKACSFHVQGTAINNEDLLKVLSGNGNWNHRLFRSVKDWSTGELLWPTPWRTLETLKRDREDMGTMIFNREMQNERSDDTEAIIKSAWLEDWEYDPDKMHFNTVEHTLVGVRICCDPSIGEKNENDDTAIGTVWKTKQKDAREYDYWIDTVDAGHYSMQERIVRIQKIVDDRIERFDRATECRVEGVAGFKDFAAELKRRIQGVGVKCIPEEGVALRDKLTNLELKAHFFENKKVHMNKNIDPRVKKEIVHQLCNNHPRRDDIRDMILLGIDVKAKSWGAFVNGQ